MGADTCSLRPGVQRVRALGSPAGTGVAGLSAAGWRRGRRGGGPGLERVGEGPREHLRPCGWGCLSPAGGPGQVPDGGARARGAGCTSCVGRSPLPRHGEHGRAWGPAEPGKELSIGGWGWEGEPLSLSSLFSWESGGLKDSWLSGPRRELEYLECAATGVEFSVGASGAEDSSTVCGCGHQRCLSVCIQLLWGRIRTGDFSPPSAFSRQRLDDSGKCYKMDEIF